MARHGTPTQSSATSSIELLARRFTITDDPGVFFLGMDHIDHVSGALTLCSRTYILNLCQRELPRPLAEYKDMQVVSDPRLMEFYETAFHIHAAPTRAFGETIPQPGGRHGVGGTDHQT